MFAYLIAALVAVGSSSHNSSRPAPFGVAMGTPISRLKVLDRYGDKYLVIRPPVPNANFVRYVVIATPPHGVCAIKAQTEDFATQDEALDKIDFIVRLLAIYGRPKLGRASADLDWLHTRPSNLDRARERIWEGGLPNKLSSISVELQRDGNQGAFRAVAWYFYANSGRCSNWEPHQDRTGL